MSLEQIRNDYLVAAVAQEKMTNALAEYQAACTIGDWKRSEVVRGVIHDNLDAFLDAFAAAHKVMRRVI